MTNWEQLLATPDYTSDTGNGPRSGTDHLAGGEFKLGNQSGPDAITLEEAFTRIGRMAGGPMLLTKTIAWAGLGFLIRVGHLIRDERHEQIPSLPPGDVGTLTHGAALQAGHEFDRGLRVLVLVVED